jgi:hypothetical protein
MLSIVDLFVCALEPFGSTQAHVSKKSGCINHTALKSKVSKDSIVVPEIPHMEHHAAAQATGANPRERALSRALWRFYLQNASYKLVGYNESQYPIRLSRSIMTSDHLRYT